MKNKFSNLNILLLLFLCIIAFSPQKKLILPINIAYAETTDDSYTGNMNTDGFQTQIGGTLNDLGLEATENTETLDDITTGLKMFIGVMGNISSYMQGFALALSACVIAWTGIKIMNSGKRNVIQFIKDKKEISNALLCVLFITFIPFLVRGILEFKPPSYLISEIVPGADGTVAISDIVAKPKSGLVEYIKTNDDLYKKSTTSEKDISSSINEEEDDTSLVDMIIQKITQAVLNILTFVIYSPLLLITVVVGAISFFPVSFDLRMYTDATIVGLAAGFFPKGSGIFASFPVENVANAAAEGLATLTSITNLLFFIVKKFALICVEFICYYYGIMHLLGNEPNDVGQFLKRLAKGVIGITLFPFIIEFLLDVDGMVSSSILRITGTSFPGFGIMTVLPPVENAKKGFTILVLSILMCAVVFSLAKSFFIRRIEITFYYIASPAFFLKDMMSSSSSGIKELTKTLLSAIFLTTVYAPVLALVNLMITLANEKTTGFVYYAIVIAMLFMGKEVIINIIRAFSSSSVSSSSAQQQFQKGLSENSTILKAAKGITAGSAGVVAYGASKASYGAAKAYNNRKDIAQNFKDMKAKGFKGNIVDGFNSGKSMVKNKVKSEYWKKYNNLDKKFGGKSLKDKNYNNQLDIEKNKAEVLERNDPNRKQLDLLKSQNANDDRATQSQNQIQNEKVKRALYDKYPNDKRRAEREYAKYEEIAKNSGKNKDALTKYKDFQKRGEAIAAKSNVPEAINSMKEYGTTLNELPGLHNDLDSAMKDGRVDDVFKINKDIERRQRFITATEASVSKMATVTNAKATRDSSMGTLKAIHMANGNIAPPKLEVRDMNSAQSFVKTISSMPEIAQNKNLQPMIAQMNQSIASQDLGKVQTSIEQFALSQRSAPGLDSSAQGKVNRELSKVFNVSSDSVRQHASVIQTGVDINSGSEAQAYYREVGNVANSKTTTISDYIAVTSGSNATHYAQAQSGVVNNVVKANTTNDIVQTAVKESKLNNGQLDYGSLQNIITQNGGGRTIQKELNELTAISAKENEKFREAAVNTPTRADYGISPITESYPPNTGAPPNGFNPSGFKGFPSGGKSPNGGRPPSSVSIPIGREDV